MQKGKSLKWGLLIVLPLVYGCGTSSISTVSLDGDPRKIVTCSGFFDSWETCYERADFVCGSKGYSVIQSSLEKPIRQRPEGTSRELLVACRE